MGNLGGSMGHRVAKRPHFEPIGQRAQGWGVASFPRLTETDNADAKFHGEERRARIEERECDNGKLSKGVLRVD
jgi:hypothetical protein